jgi:hypothetical protein
LTSVLPRSRDTFTHWINVELSDITEVSEDALAHDIQRRGQRIFSELSLGLSGIPDYQEFYFLHQRLNDLIQMNRAAMFRADSRATHMSDRLACEFAIGLIVLLALGAALSWALASNISKSLADLSEHLRSFSLRSPRSG